MHEWSSLLSSPVPALATRSNHLDPFDCRDRASSLQCGQVFIGLTHGTDEVFER